ncbi:jupiter microtubule associated homolog 1 [Tribolium madens]|uniref:jupiter microtubule associated homolog 1 n=1 Tax=Tribolium madens TaxID=41895 RepID=UPI001CF72A7B|nr:jupiter microtubule associated homolog 1 [Tribolium madens]
MTSTNVFRGMDGGRSSSRVLKPPGGGHTDVLGLSVPPEKPQEKKFNRRNASSIIEGTNEPKPVVEKVEEKPVQKVEEKPVQKEEEKPIQKEEEKPKEPVKQATDDAPKAASAPPPQNNTNSRGRVPPGGFSSGAFW